MRFIHVTEDLHELFLEWVEEVWGLAKVFPDGPPDEETSNSWVVLDDQCREMGYIALEYAEDGTAWLHASRTPGTPLKDASNALKEFLASDNGSFIVIQMKDRPGLSRLLAPYGFKLTGAIDGTQTYRRHHHGQITPR